MAESEKIINCPACRTPVKYLPGGYCPACAAELDASYEQTASPSGPIYIGDYPTPELKIQPRTPSTVGYRAQPAGHSANPYQSPVAALLESEQQRGLFWILFGFKGRIPRRVYWAATVSCFFVFFIVANVIDEAGYMEAQRINHWVPADDVPPELRDSVPGEFSEQVEFRQVQYSYSHAGTAWWAIILRFAINVLSVWISIALSIKRFHDVGKSGWWYCIVFIPCVGWLWLLIENGFLESQRGANQYGPHPG